MSDLLMAQGVFRDVAGAYDSLSVPSRHAPAARGLADEGRLAL